MNEVGGGIVCPQCQATNMSIAAFCFACGISLRQAGNRLPDQAHGAAQIQLAMPAEATSLVQQESEHYQAPPPVPAYPAQFAPPAPAQAAPTQYAPQYIPPQPHTPQYQPATAAYQYPPQPAPTYNEPPTTAYATYAPGMAPLSINVSPVINMQAPVTMPMPPQPIVVVNDAAAPSLVVRALWFLFFGLWLGLIATVVGWALCVGVVTLPIGLLILNRLPAIMTLQPPTRGTQVVHAYGVTTIHTNVGPVQRPFYIRALYFAFIGWWLSAIWLVLAWIFVAFSVVTLGMSLVPAFMMFNRVPYVLTLREN